MVFSLSIAASSSMPPLLPSVDASDAESEVPCGFEPRVAIVVGVLASLLCVTFFLVLYGRHCKRIISSRAAATVASTPATTSHHQAQARTLRLPLDSHGNLSQWLLDALPKLQSSTKLQGLGILGLEECPVCLSRYETGDLLRLLPRCKHAFHVVCVDKWLSSRPSCPVCRTFVSCQDVVDLDNYYLEEQPAQSAKALPGSPGSPAVVIEVTDAHDDERNNL